MKDKIIRILSTRPLDEALVSKALEQDIVIDALSFIQTENIIDQIISDRITNLAKQSLTAVFTSMNAAEAVIKTLSGKVLQPEWDVYCIGAATQSLIKAHFTAGKIVATGKNAAALAEAIIRDRLKTVVFFCGNQRREELPELLQKSDIKVEEIVVYKTIEIPVKVEKNYNGILFFSPSAVKSFFSVNSISTDTVLFSIGDTTAAEIKKFSHTRIIVSDFPSKDKLVEIAVDYFLKTDKPND